MVQMCIARPIDTLYCEEGNIGREVREGEGGVRGGEEESEGRKGGGRGGRE